jgi:hypothetical protein
MGEDKTKVINLNTYRANTPGSYRDINQKVNLGSYLSDLNNAPRIEPRNLDQHELLNSIAAILVTLIIGSTIIIGILMALMVTR